MSITCLVTQLVHWPLPGADMVVEPSRYSAELGDVVVGRVTDVRARLQDSLCLCSCACF